MATTTVKIKYGVGLYSPTLPFNTLNGQVIAFNESNGSVTWQPNNNYSGISTQEFQYEIFCDNIPSGQVANVLITVTPQTGVIDITDGLGGLPNLTPICGTINVYKSSIVFTPALPIVSPITYLWTVTSGFTINSGQGTDTINLLTNSGFGGIGTLTITATTPFEVLTNTINLDAICATAVNDNVTTTVNTPITFNISLNDSPCL
jgi:hypothetical protein